MNNKAIIVNNLSIWYKNNQPIFNNVSFNVAKAELHGFIGPNGIGKTSTIKTLIGANKGYSGSIVVNDIPLEEGVEKLNIGYIPEKPNFVRGVNVYRYLISMCGLAGLNKEEAIEYVDRELTKYGLQQHKWLSPFSLSSGQMKKIMLIEALATQPSLLILDEPAANLDPSSRQELLELLKELTTKGVTVFITSHILDEIEKFATSITILSNTGIAFSGSMADLKKTYQPISEYKFIFKTIEDAHAFGVWAQKYEFHPSISHDKLEILISKSNFDKDHAMKFIVDSKLKCEGFYENKKTLSEIFQKVVAGGANG